MSEDEFGEDEFGEDESHYNENEDPMENPSAVSANPVFDVVDGHSLERRADITPELLNGIGRSGSNLITDAKFNSSGAISIASYALLYLCSSNSYLWENLLSREEREDVSRIADSAKKRLNDMTATNPTSKKFNELLRNY